MSSFQTGLNEQCEHNSGQDITEPIHGTLAAGEYTIWRCDWGCNELLVSLVNEKGITETWPLDSRELATQLNQLQQENAALKAIIETAAALPY